MPRLGLLDQYDHVNLYAEAMRNGFFETAHQLVLLGARPLFHLPFNEVHFSFRPMLSDEAMHRLCEDSIEDIEDFIFKQLAKPYRNIPVLSRLISIAFENEKFKAHLVNKLGKKLADFICHPLYKDAFVAYIQYVNIDLHHFNLNGFLSSNGSFVAFTRKIFFHQIKKAIDANDEQTVKALFSLYKDNIQALCNASAVLLLGNESSIPGVHFFMFFNECLSFIFKKKEFVMADVLMHLCDRETQARLLNAYVNPTEIADGEGILGRLLAAGCDISGLALLPAKKDELEFHKSLLLYQAYLKAHPEDIILKTFEECRLRHINPVRLGDAAEKIKAKLLVIHPGLPGLFDATLQRFHNEIPQYVSRKGVGKQATSLPEVLGDLVTDYDCLVPKPKDEKANNSSSSVVVEQNNIADERLINVTELKQSLKKMVVSTSVLGRFFSTTSTMQAEQINKVLSSIESKDDVFVLKLTLALLNDSNYQILVCKSIIPETLLRVMDKEFLQVNDAVPKDLQQKLKMSLMRLGVPEKAINSMTLDALLRSASQPAPVSMLVRQVL